jgi:hypothetical protein
MLQLRQDKIILSGHSRIFRKQKRERVLQSTAAATHTNTACRKVVCKILTRLGLRYVLLG